MPVDEARPSLGAFPLPEGGVVFRVWAPRAQTLAVELCGPPARVVEMTRGAGHVFEARVPDAGAGDDYYLLLDGVRRLADPTSRHQPAGVHGPSRIVDFGAFRWTDGAFAGRPLDEYVVYELHVGTFTPEGTFDAAVPRLAELAALGITAVEIMPVAEFPGPRNWGYDGAHPFAPQSTYGGPDGLARFVDACHAHGLAVVLDVVYNHLGPEGSVLGQFAPIFTDRYRTPWGSALDFEGPDSAGLRRLVVDNAIQWLRDYHVDALRLDAVDRIHDSSARHILAEMHDAFSAEAQRLGRKAHVIAECDFDDVRILTPPAEGGWGLDGQWLDDFHHSMHALLRPERHGPLSVYGQLSDLVAAIRGAHDARPGHGFVVFVQNHDQVANTARGMRHGTLLDLEQAKLAACLLLTMPYVPLLFMGQEYGETRPFDYFVSHGDAALIASVRKGRRREHVGLARAPVPDPQSEATFAASKLDWSSRERSPHREILGLHRELLTLRRENLALSNGRRDLTRILASEEDRTVVIERSDPSGARALVVANLSNRPRTLEFPVSTRWRLAIWSADPRFSGPIGGSPPAAAIAPPSAVVPCGPWTACVYVHPGE